MGFGILLFFIIVPFHIMAIILSLIFREWWLLKMIAYGWVSLIILWLCLSFISIFYTKKTIKQADIYGSYIIDRSKFSGHQADWQYNHFRFEITESNQLIFFETKGRKVIKADTIEVYINTVYKNNRLVVESDTTNHHIVQSSPALYRTVWSHYYVFHSEKFGNVFFKKGRWKEI